tara:strand:- start:1176 stop:1547 length:372 start_codon:yes stop_codon:yes gene_type:complete
MGKTRKRYDAQMQKARELDQKASEKDKEKHNAGARLRRRAGRVRGRAGSINDVVDNNPTGPGKKDDIKIDPKNKGKFTAWVKKNMPGKDTCSAAQAVMKNKKKYTTRVVKMANFAKNFACAKK